MDTNCKMGSSDSVIGKKLPEEGLNPEAVV